MRQELIVCQLGQSGGSGPLFDGDTEPQQCLVLQPPLSPAVFFTLLSVAWACLPWWFPPWPACARSFVPGQNFNFVDILSMSVLLSWHTSFLFHNHSQPYWYQFTRVLDVRWRNTYLYDFRASNCYFIRQTGVDFDSETFPFLLHTIKLSITIHTDKLNRSLET